jgi:tRNA(Ile)-lysidine synthase
MLPKAFDPFVQFVHGPALAGRHVLVAVSGGIDSVTLLHALSLVRESAELRLGVAHVHHGLRDGSADLDESLVAALAAQHGLGFESARIDPQRSREGIAQRARPTLQEAARRLRYEALEGLREKAGADCIVTAHHLGDQAETVLWRLLRGTSPDGLAGIPPVSRSGRLVRPLLGVERVDIEAFARSEALRWREDESNESDAYTRNRLRRHWLPGLSADFNPQLLRAVGKLAEAQRRDSAWIARAVAEAWPDWIEPEGGDLLLRLAGWGELPDALSHRLIERAVRALGGGRDQSRTHIERALAFLSAPERHEGGRSLELPGGLRLVRESKAWRLRAEGAVVPDGA